MLRRDRCGRSRADAGSAEIQELLFGFVVLMSFALIALQFADRLAMQWAAREAAREGARSAVVQHDALSAVHAGTASARQTLTAHRVDIDTASIELAFDPGTAELDGCMGPPFCRGATVSARVTVRLPELELLLFGTVAATSWSAEHHERIDRFRAIAGEATH